jgi:hypothetical protein
LLFVFLHQKRDANFGYGAAKMMIFENRSGAHPCIIPSSFDEGKDYAISIITASFTRHRRVVPCVREYRKQRKLPFADRQSRNSLVDGEKDGTVVQARSGNDKAVPDGILEA